MSRKSIFQLSYRQKKRRIDQDITPINQIPLKQKPQTYNEINNLNDISLTETINPDSSVIIPTNISQAICCTTTVDKDSSNNHLSNYINASFMNNATPDKFILKEWLNNELCAWVTECNIAHSAVSRLLVLLKKIPGLSEVPSDVRTLMKTPRNNSNIIVLEDGQYAHFSFKENLNRSITQNYIDMPDIVKVNINIDGLPLTKSSGSQFWPVLGAIVDDFYTEPFPITVFHGYHKPKSIQNLLQPLVDEYKTIAENGILINGKKINIIINAIICDAPARAFVTGVKGHNAYFGCSKCIQEGEFIEGRMTFPENTATLRSDNSFKNRLHIEHHHSPDLITPLEKLNIGMVSQVPLDYMHLVCLGVTKKLLAFWVNGKKDVRLKPNQIELLSNRLSSLKVAITNEFARKPRKITEFERWKATEFRQFLLYTGLVVLKNILSQDQYDHFVALSISIRILLDRSIYLKLNSYSKSLLQWFTKNFQILYGEHHLVYNVHNLIHLPDDAKKFGPLDQFSAFKFENYMQKIKKKVKTTHSPLQQFRNRIAEQVNVPIAVDNFQEPKVIYVKGTIKKIQFKGFALSAAEYENCFEHVNGSIFEIVEIVKSDQNVTLNSRMFTIVESLFNYPADSKKFNINCVEIGTCMLNIHLNEVKRKCLKLFLDDKLVIIPFIHSD